MPAGGKITYGIAVDSFIDDAYVLPGGGGAEKFIDDFDIAITERIAKDFGDRTKGATVRNRITDHEQCAVGMDFYGISFEVAFLHERRGPTYVDIVFS